MVTMATLMPAISIGFVAQVRTRNANTDRRLTTVWLQCKVVPDYLATIIASGPSTTRNGRRLSLCHFIPGAHT
jgi:hypothetical protein